MNADNPLLGLNEYLPFDRIQAAHIEPAIGHLLTHARAGLSRLIAEDTPSTYSATLGALDALLADLDDTMGLISHLESVLEDAALRDAYNAAQPKVTAFYAELSRSDGLYATIKAFSQTDEAQKLDATKARYLAQTLDEFRRNGAALPPPEKARLDKIDVELAEITTRFAQNVVDDTERYQWDLTDIDALAGLPPSAISAARATADAAGVEGWRFTLRAPSFIAVQRYLDDAKMRETLYRAYSRRATTGDSDNQPILDRILALRAEKAGLLGYSDVSDLHLEPRMVKTGDRAAAFVQTLEDRTTERFKAEHAELMAFRAQFDSGDVIPPWSVGYYAEKLRMERFDFDSEALRPYFSADRVMSGMFEIVSRLYGIKVTPIEDRPTWHPDVKTFAIDEADGTRIGTFYADIYPRAGKRGGAWMRPLLTGELGKTPHVGLICANLTPPVGDQPALLTHREVETLFHEFGHLLHHLLTQVEVRSLAGTNVAWDFVELPSQIMENWCWEREALDLFARHYQTDAPIPDDLFTKMAAARTFRGASAQMRQLGFASVDLALHRTFDPQTSAVLPFARDIAQRFTPAELPDDYAMIASFTHLFASPVGYAAGYYSYKWAEVLDADAFTRFQSEGLFSPKVGDAFRREILARGDSRDPAALFEAFMGRGPDQEALLIRAGLA